jgi:hypothetical protein
VGWISYSSNTRNILPRIARPFSRSTTDTGRRTRCTTFSYVPKENDSRRRIRPHMLSVSQTAMASVLPTAQIRRVSCTKEFHAQGTCLLVSLRVVSSSFKNLDPFTTSSLSINLHHIHPMHSICITIIVIGLFFFPFPDIIGFRYTPLILISSSSTHPSFSFMLQRIDYTFSSIGRFIFILLVTYI